MAIEKFNKNMAIIAALDDEPNDVGGMTSAELKNKFDEGGKAIQSYMNETLIPALENLGVETAVLLPQNAAGFKYIRLNSDKVLEVSTDGTNWQATGSSGHIIIDKDGKQLPQRSRMKFAGSVVTDDGTNTVVQGVKGDKGDTGATGAQGPQGVQGVKGDRGQVFVPSINDDGVISWSIQEPTTTIPASRNIRGPQGIQGIQGPQGLQGPVGATGAQGIQGPIGAQGPKGNDGADGRSFTIKAMYASLAELNAAHPTGAEGDAYAVGTAESNTIYNWDVDRNLWNNIGPIRGPQGEQGIQGVQGIQGIQGSQGPQGEQGVQGPQGEQGIQGPEGPQGPRGYPANINGKTPDDAGNITLNAGDISGSVRYDAAQSLTDAQKQQARGNISTLNGQFLALIKAGGQIGWYRITEPFAESSTSGYLTVSQSWASGGPSELLLGVSTTPNTHGNLQCLRGVGKSNSVPYISNARLIKIANKYALDLYVSGTGKNDWDLQLCNCGHNPITLTTPTFISADDTLPDGETLEAVMEYQNPHMLLGVEYKTTERYLGKPVYVKAVDCGNFPAPGSTKNVSHGVSNCLPIMVTGRMSNSNTLPWLDKFTVSADNTNIALYSAAGSVDFSKHTVMAILKYTKTTD